MDKAAQRIRTFSMGFLISGVLSILIGAHYLFVKAGIPYQDPPLKLQIQYAVNMGIGEKMFLIGLTTLFIGCIGITIAWICTKTEKIQKPKTIK